MINKLSYVLVLIACATLVGCSSGNNPEPEDVTVIIDTIDAEEVLTLSPDADIFQYADVIYQTNIDWVDELTLTPKEVVGEINAQNETSTDFENEMSTKIPVGTEIYSAEERSDMLMVEVGGMWKNYYAIVEG